MPWTCYFTYDWAHKVPLLQCLPFHRSNYQETTRMEKEVWNCRTQSPSPLFTLSVHQTEVFCSPSLYSEPRAQTQVSHSFCPCGYCLVRTSVRKKEILREGARRRREVKGLVTWASANLTMNPPAQKWSSCVHQFSGLNPKMWWLERSLGVHTVYRGSGLRWDGGNGWHQSTNGDAAFLLEYHVSTCKTESHPSNGFWHLFRAQRLLLVLEACWR